MQRQVFVQLSPAALYGRLHIIPSGVSFMRRCSPQSVRRLQVRLRFNDLVTVRWSSTKPGGDKNIKPLDYIPTGSVQLYENNNTRPNFFSVIASISGIQLLFWIYLAYFALTELKVDETKISDDKQNRNSEFDLESKEQLVKYKFDSLNEEAPSMKENNDSLPASVLWSSKLRIIVSLLSLGTGLFFAVSACMYPLRVVHRLKYIRTTQAVQIVTYTPFGKTRTLTAPLSDVTCSGSRLDGPKKGHFGLKVKGHSLFFLLDQQAMDSSPNVRMFDRIIGTRQKVY